MVGAELLVHVHERGESLGLALDGEPVLLGREGQGPVQVSDEDLGVVLGAQAGQRRTVAPAVSGRDVAEDASFDHVTQIRSPAYTRMRREPDGSG